MSFDPPQNSLKPPRRKQRKEEKAGKAPVLHTQSPAPASISSPGISNASIQPSTVPPTAQIPAPWEAWKLDRQFLKELDEWNAKHPENKLDRILQNICVSIDQGKELLEAIPDAPLPIRGFVKALVHLVKLGATISQAKLKAQQFAQSIVRWPQGLASTLAGSESDDSISDTWENLAVIRDLIDEICVWAHATLNDGVAKRLIRVDIVVADFESRLSNAMERFQVLSTIILTRMVAERKRADERRDFFATTLDTRTIQEATYDSQDKHPCDDDTRIDILQKIKTWLHDISDDPRCFYWLSGEPGAGKSAITASIAEYCKDHKILWAQFFINRNDPKTTDPRTFFPTIARQMSDRSPDVARAVEKTLKDQGSLMDDISEGQARGLFIKALQVASECSSKEPVVIVIDALDETDVKRLRSVAAVFSSVLVDLPRNARVFISSRVEDVIQVRFGKLSNQRVKHTHLHTAASKDEVGGFMRRKIRRIMEDNQLAWPQWSDDRMGALCAQASGLYIWAVTAVEFIRAEIEYSGTDCIGTVLDELNANGMNDINMLYLAILTRTHKAETSEWDYQRFRRIVGAIVVQQSRLCLADLKGLLNLQLPETHQPVDVKHFVRRHRTVLVTGANRINDHTAPRVHRSFIDFITSDKAQRFRVDTTTSNGELALQCIRQITIFFERRFHRSDDETYQYKPLLSAEDRSPAQLSEEDRFPAQLSYAGLHWSSHLTQLVGAPRAAEVLADSDDIVSLDAEPIASVAEENAGVQASVKVPSPLVSLLSSIVLSPDGQRIAIAPSDKTIHILDSKTGDPIGSPLKGHSEWVKSVDFSPDGTRIASASFDRTICIWDSKTGALTLGPLKGHLNTVHSVVFSPDGTHIASASADDTIRVWDVRTGQSIGSPLVGHSNLVSLVVFSPDGTRIASASRDRMIRIWNVETGEAFGSPLEHSDEILSVIFSPDGTRIVSASRDTIYLWDPDTGVQVTKLHCNDRAMLSFADIQSHQYLISPQPADMYPPGTSELCSFNLIRGRIHGVIVPGAASWTYTNGRIVMSSYPRPLSIRVG